jgi:hypothetical protein
MDRLKGKIALISGAARGQGAADIETQTGVARGPNDPAGRRNYGDE